MDKDIKTQQRRVSLLITNQGN